jgi:hypothetical protein
MAFTASQLEEIIAWCSSTPALGLERNQARFVLAIVGSTDAKRATFLELEDERFEVRDTTWAGVVKLSEAKAAMDAKRRAGLSVGGISWAHSAQCDVQPYGVTLGADLSIAGSRKEVSTRTEVIADSAERSQETLGVLSGFETLEHPLAFAGRQVRILRPIVQTLVSPMLGVRQHLSNGWRVACELVRDHDARSAPSSP